MLGLEVGTSEAEPIGTDFLRTLTRRGLRGVPLVGQSTGRNAHSAGRSASSS